MMYCRMHVAAECIYPSRSIQISFLFTFLVQFMHSIIPIFQNFLWGEPLLCFLADLWNVSGVPAKLSIPQWTSISSPSPAPIQHPPSLLPCITQSVFMVSIILSILSHQRHLPFLCHPFNYVLFMSFGFWSSGRAGLVWGQHWWWMTTVRGHPILHLCHSELHSAFNSNIFHLSPEDMLVGGDHLL